jgi:hypothetical protein
MRCRIAIVALISASVISLWFLFRFTPQGYTRIELIQEDNGNILFSGVLKDGERVILAWRNSQFGLDVTEAFFVREGVLIQDQVIFSAPDGTPPPRVSAKDVDDLFHTGGPFDARGLSKPFTRIVYRIGEIGNPKLLVRDKTISFRKETGFGGRVILTAVRPAFYETIFHR